MKHQAHKNECRVGARQVAKTLSKYTADFIAAGTRFATANTEFCIVFVVLVVQCVVLVWRLL